MSGRRGFPALRYGIALVLIGLVAFGPVLAAMAADAIAAANGCSMADGADHTCLIGGLDLGPVLYFFYLLGWLTLITLPLGVIGLMVWGVVLVVHLVRYSTRKAS